MTTIRNGERGFTLIELLVVIAIIGLLSSVIIASLNSARSKGNDAAIKQNMNAVRTQAELFYDNNSQSYYGTGSPTMCGDTTIAAALSSAATLTGSTVNSTLTAAGANNLVSCHVAANGSAYAIQAPLKTSSNYWCIDSTGRSAQEGTALAASATVCS